MPDMKNKPEDFWKQKLSPEQYQILREKGTEAPFTGDYVDHHKDGMYRCAACGASLFSSAAKYDSHSGWPSFFEAVDPEKVELHDDSSHGMKRVEVTCANCGGHLGHVFDDGPNPTNQRFCINSCSLKFEGK